MQNLVQKLYTAPAGNRMDKRRKDMAQYTQKAIIDTFQDMLKKMPFDKITVTAIVSACEISSNTFYYHYRDIYDLLDVWLQIKWKKYFVDKLESMSWQNALKELLKAMQSNADLVYHLSAPLSRERIERFVFESTDDIFYRLVCMEAGDARVPEEVLRIVAEYNSYVQWVIKRIENAEASR